MGVFDSVKDKVKEQQQKLADKITSLPVEYMGGYGGRDKAHGILTFYQGRIEFNRVSLGQQVKTRFSFTIPNADIVDITLEGKDEVLQQRTITRNLLAFGKSKKQEVKEAYIVIVLVDSQEVLFHIKDQSPMELKARLASALSQIKQSKVLATPTTSVSQGSVADELTKLAKLKDQGIITQADFDKKKIQLLG